MPLVNVKPLSELPPGAVSPLDIKGAPYALCNVDGTIYCVEGTCPHAGGPLGEGNLRGNYVVCPWHGWEYDCRTGLNDSDEDVRIQTFPAMVQDGHILIDVP